jgi:Putative zinc-finger
MNCEAALAQLSGYLTCTLTPVLRSQVRRHLDDCDGCWGGWDAYRWDRATGTQLHRDLEGFLGPRFRPRWDSSRALAREWEQADPRSPDQAADFFRNSLAYLHNLVIWEASGNRPAYVAAAAPVLAVHGARSVIDYGCGTGSDTLALRRLGYQVLPCDYDSPSTRFFAWRARREGSDPRTIEPGDLPAGLAADTLWIIDTIDHLADPASSIGRLLFTVRIVISERMTADRAHGRHRFYRRRPATEIHQLYESCGFRPAQPSSATSPIECWTKPPGRPSREPSGATE